MEDLITKVMEKTKKLIARDKQMIIVDEVWRTYSRRFIKTFT